MSKCIILVASFQKSPRFCQILLLFFQTNLTKSNFKKIQLWRHFSDIIVIRSPKRH